MIFVTQKLIIPRNVIATDTVFKTTISDRKYIDAKVAYIHISEYHFSKAFM